ncbi:hypothetical protein AM593_04004, partial [Mytilus galloprovincialis]
MDSLVSGAPPPSLLKELNRMLPEPRYGPPKGIPPPPPPPTGLPIPKTPFGPREMAKSSSSHLKQNQVFSSTSPRAQLLSDISDGSSAKKMSGLTARGGSARVLGSITKPLSIIEKDIPSQLDSADSVQKQSNTEELMVDSHASLFDNLRSRKFKKRM